MLHRFGGSAYFPYRWRHRPTHRPLNPATSNNSNNGGLLLLFVFLATYSPCSRVWVAAAVRPHYQSTQTLLVSLHKPFSSSSSCCVQFLLLLSVCIKSASFMHMLRLFFSVFDEFQAPPIDLEYEVQRVESLQWIRLDANILETMPRKTEEKKNSFGTSLDRWRFIVLITAVSPSLHLRTSRWTTGQLLRSRSCSVSSVSVAVFVVRLLL